MSRGAGHVERKIADIFADNPDKFFAAGTLCQMIWPGLNRIEHKHRVSVIRAASRIAEKTKWTRTSMPSWTAFKGVERPPRCWTSSRRQTMGVPDERPGAVAMRVGVREELCPPTGWLLSPSRTREAHNDQYISLRRGMQHRSCVDAGRWGAGNGLEIPTPSISNPSASGSRETPLA
jgi:hypothetical protein